MNAEIKPRSVLKNVFHNMTLKKHIWPLYYHHIIKWKIFGRVWLLKNLFFSNDYISVNTIFECCYLFFGWEIGHPLSTCATEGMEGGHPKCVHVHTGGEGHHASCVPTHLQTITLFMFFSYGVLSLPSLKRGCFCIYSNLHKKQAFDFLKRISYTNVCLKFLCDAKLIMPLLIL